MNFSDTISPKKNEKIVIDNPLEGWPEHYYEETDPSARLSMLDEAIKSEIAPQEDQIRKKIFDMRYKPNKYADGGYADLFMRVFMQFSMNTKSSPGPFAMSRVRKKTLKDLKSVGLCAADSNDLYESVLLKEFIHLGQFYIAISADSKQYNTLIWGFGKISEKKLIQKLYADLASASIDVADMFDLHDEMNLWLKGIDEARARMLPTTEPFLC